MSYLLDTCVLSEATKKDPEASVLAWLAAVSEEECFVSVLTLGEIQKGVTKLPESAKKRQLDTWLHNDLRQRFDSRILGITVDVSIRWGRLLGKLEQQGVRIPAVDSLIAATALSNGLVLVTRNVAGFEASGADTLNPWRCS